MRIPYRYKLSLSIGLLSVLITGGALFFFYRTIYRTVWDQMTLRLMDVAGTGISLMSQEEKDSLARFARKVQEITPADSLGSRLRTMV